MHYGRGGWIRTNDLQYPKHTGNAFARRSLPAITCKPAKYGLQNLPRRYLGPL